MTCCASFYCCMLSTIYAVQEFSICIYKYVIDTVIWLPYSVLSKWLISSHHYIQYPCHQVRQIRFYVRCYLISVMGSSGCIRDLPRLVQIKQNKMNVCRGKRLYQGNCFFYCCCNISRYKNNRYLTHICIYFLNVRLT